MLKKSLIVTAVSVVLSGCGGSGGSDEEVVRASINAGQDVTVIEKNEFTLKATASPTGGTFNWQVTSGPSFEGFPQTGEELTVTAPDVKGDSLAVLKVDYLAPSGELVSDTLNVNITSNNQLPVAKVTQTGPETPPSKYLDTVVLSAEESSDPDENGQVVGYKWELISGPSNITVEDSGSVTLSFVHPLLADTQTAVWRLTVTDDEGGSTTTDFSVALAKNDKVVLANAGDDQQVLEFDTVTLDATKSMTVDGQYTCAWQQSSTGDSITLADSSACKTTFQAPDKDDKTFATFKVTVTDSSNRTGDDEVRIDILPKPLSNLNDSGASACYNDTAIINCENTEFPRQDAELGRDSVAQVISKEGTGSLAFDFTKLDADGKELRDDASTFSCVRDNITGLVWEVKEATAGTLPNTSTRNAQNHYTWALDPDGTELIGSEYPVIAPAPCPHISDTYRCGVQAFINRVNSESGGYCGGNTWRLPSYTELMSIVDFGRVGVHVLDPTFFPNVPQTSLQGHLYYWTIQTAVGGTDGSDGNLTRAYVIDMETGNDVPRAKAQTAYVRLVRGNTNAN
ncbi:DUF1566 domain-containing protein [Pseudoalteromonas luteoviolacea]|uniref:Lcl C-terminal domain-containing protein n=1 Tax=Pseudoalteromonas luteoviolacea S4054 TaxID=1129367 RepID=A0A0F6ADN3_9GAMM|nr:DUF1566 domain-containing protein [Pseudoalteromonas luteoviolacea]AOT09650.1 hypothetical protein S4054249_18305 [Pseudoalteromonas luteoviolacea]AOT14563.1 hypothetical protein S40542_18275 [Pseudoalteromonas luteoviolacea]AOT19477.1 hypothetical protein S4054_18280 [Pseudoalteromonas luteoviolacea]KKE83916.1 hypothetical protein N479_10925 [Pseudoalteromonas luteoviolacea S4054]KZN77310.1 hypothetical protein N481_04465 [Pseudoalteromonas luteoviolacea S4047-1]